MALNAGPNKRMNGGRLRNTATNIASKNNGRIPGVPGTVGPPQVPGFGADYGGAAGATGQLAGAYAQFQGLAAAYRAQRVGIKAGFKSARVAARGQGVADMSGVQNDAIDRGVLGSSAVNQSEIGVHADVQANIEAARQEKISGLSATKVGEQQAYLDYTVAVDSIAAQAEAARQANEIAAAQVAATEAGNASLSDLYAQFVAGEKVLDPAVVKDFTTVTGHGLTQTESGQIVVPGSGGDLSFDPSTPMSVILSKTKKYFADLANRTGPTGYQTGGGY